MYSVAVSLVTHAEYDRLKENPKDELASGHLLIN
jgi:hypothetical protein